MFEFRMGKIPFDSATGPPEKQHVIETFPGKVLSFAVGLTAFDMKYTDPNGDTRDHLFHLARARVNGTLFGQDGHAVKVVGEIGLKDDTGNWDDFYRGSLDYALVADVDVPPPPTTETLHGLVRAIKTTGVGPTRGVLVQLFIPLDEKMVDIAVDLSHAEPPDLVLVAMLRDALALSLPVACEVVSASSQGPYALVNASVDTRRTFHQAGWQVANGAFQETPEKPRGSVRGKVTCIYVRAFGLLKGTNDDLPDVAQIGVGAPGGTETVLYLGLQGVDPNTNISAFTMLHEAYRDGREVTVGYFLDPLHQSDITPVKWVESVQYGG